MGLVASFLNPFNDTTSKNSANAAHVECSSCHGIFVNPHKLPCGHTVCRQCMVKQGASTSNRTSYFCSTCGQSCALPEGDTGRGSKLAWAPSRETSSLTLAGAVDHKFLCKTHTDQKIVVYCKDCRILTCALCVLTSHTKHTYIEVDEADMEFKQEINVAVEKCKKMMETHRQCIKDYDEKLREKQVQLETEKGLLAHYEVLLNSNYSSFIEREAAVKTLQPNHQLQTDHQLLPNQQLQPDQQFQPDHQLQPDHQPQQVLQPSQQQEQFVKPQQPSQRRPQVPKTPQPNQQPKKNQQQQQAEEKRFDFNDSDDDDF